MKIATYYHSGLAPEKDVEPCERFQWQGNIALVNDLRNGLPPEFNTCDVIYVEPPWNVGFQEFNRRVGLRGIKFKKFMSHLAGIITAYKGPFYCVAGEAAIQYLPEPRFRVKIKLHDVPAFLLVYNDSFLTANKVPNNLDVLKSLAGTYNRVGDFCCGYGVAGRVFVGEGKTCVLADYNPKCIGEIKQSCAEWARK